MMPLYEAENALKNVYFDIVAQELSKKKKAEIKSEVEE